MSDYWYVDYVGFEQKQSRKNRLILGLRHWNGNGTKRKQIFLEQNVKIPTRFIHRKDGKKLQKIVQLWESNPELHEHKLIVYLSERDAKHIGRLRESHPGLEVRIRKGDYDVFQIEMPYDRGLIARLNGDFQNGNFDRNFRFDNDLLYRKAELNGEGIKLRDEKITLDEFKEQVWFYADIEKPLFKSQREKQDLDRREHFFKLKNGKRKKFREKLERLVAGGKSREEVNLQVSRILERLEKRLTKQIGEREVRLWESEYDAKISWYTCILKRADGSELRELHTLRDCGLDELNGYNIVLHQSEKELLNAVIGLMKNENVAVFSNHNLPYDITQTRFASEETGADSFDLFIENVFPRRDVVRKVYQRMKKDIEYIDSYRIASVFYPWLENKKLETFAQFMRGADSFEKSLTYAEMRELEVKAIHGDKKAALELADYATKDVEPIKEIVENDSHLETFFRVRDMFPFLTLTEIAFSPRAVKKYFAWKHWQRNGNNRHFGYEGKVRQDEEQIFKKRFGPLKREYLSNWGVQVPNISGVHQDVVQAYLPIELWLREIVCSIEPGWDSYYALLSDEPVERFGQLRYPREFCTEFLMDHYFAVNEQKRFSRRLKGVSLSEETVSKVLDGFRWNADGETLNKYIASLRNLRNQYRSIYVKLNAKSRKEVREPKRFHGQANLRFDFVDFFEEDNSDLLGLRSCAPSLSERVPDSQKKEIKRFMSNFETFDEKRAELARGAPSNVPGISPENIAYFYALREGFRRRANRFRFEYGVGIDDVSRSLREGYEDLTRELQTKGTQAICHRGDYLFLKGGNLEELKMVIPVRKIEYFSVSPIEECESASLLGF